VRKVVVVTTPVDTSSFWKNQRKWDELGQICFCIDLGAIEALDCSGQLGSIEEQHEDNAGGIKEMLDPFNGADRKVGAAAIKFIEKDILGYFLVTSGDFSHVTGNIATVGITKSEHDVTSSMLVTSPQYHLGTAGNLHQTADQLPRLPTFCIDQLDQFPQLRPMTSRPGIATDPSLTFYRRWPGGLSPRLPCAD
jgi:hypothetical protein